MKRVSKEKLDKEKTNKLYCFKNKFWPQGRLPLLLQYNSHVRMKPIFIFL